ncbi:MAG: UDP-N-acetylglucosamine pyrophosphorylase [Nitrospinaceae bacterium]|nr:MAG: UDP-N-acetylglucosamine pyrophosphorylase [Nitrospinaceae bacterium]
MKSPLAKVLQPLSGRPLLYYVLEIVKQLSADRVSVVVGFQSKEVKTAFSDPGIEFVEQKEQLGTGHAAQQTESCLADFSGDILVLCGDMPLIKASTLKNLLKKHRESGASCTLLTLKDNQGKIKDFGRIIRDKDQSIVRIVENKDATPAEKKVDEYNSGVYCFDKSLFYKALLAVDNRNSQKEYYLTDTIRFFVENQYSVQSVQTEDSDEIFGINSPEDLQKAEQLLREGDASL